MKGWEVQLIDKIERAEGTNSFRFNRPRDFEYRPGQYFFISIPKEERHLMHHFSFSSSPTEKDHIEFTTRVRDSEFKQTMDSLPIGSKVNITEVHGEFTLEERMKKTAFVCGGIGITATRSNIRWADDTKADVDIVLLYANHNLEAAAFQKELEELSGNHVNVVHILSEPGEGWTGPKGHIDAGFIKANVPDLRERRFFVSGPPAMVESIRKLLEDELVVQKERIKLENFLGY
jgi:ferredoxin-NADP reductase